MLDIYCHETITYYDVLIYLLTIRCTEELRTLVTSATANIWIWPLFPESISLHLQHFSIDLSLLLFCNVVYSSGHWRFSVVDGSSALKIDRTISRLDFRNGQWEHQQCPILTQIWEYFDLKISSLLRTHRQESHHGPNSYGRPSQIASKTPAFSMFNSELSACRHEKSASKDFMCTFYTKQFLDSELCNFSLSFVTSFVGIVSRF